MGFFATAGFGGFLGDLGFFEDWAGDEVGALGSSEKLAQPASSSGNRR
jgi:hypothetical protein